MQDAEMPITGYAETQPDSHVMIKRLLALFIDSIILAYLIWWMSKTFGTPQFSATQSSTDTIIPGALVGAGGTFTSVSNGSGGTILWSIKLSPIWQFLIVYLYFSLQEYFFCATIGKFMLRLRVISQIGDTTYTRLTLKAALLRNLVRFIDAYGTYFLGFIVCMCSSRRRRLGDMLAKTLVVRQTSVSYLVISKQQSRRGLWLITSLLIAIALGCPLLSYFWQPPLIIQNNSITQQLIPNEQIFHYTLGEKTWSHDDLGRQTVTYPINFTSAYLPKHTIHSCTGTITLVWLATQLSWQENASNANCKDQ